MNQSKQLEEEPEQSQWIENIQSLKSPLTKSVPLTHLSEEELQSLYTLLKQFTPTYNKLKKVARLLFMIAGFLWFPIFFANALGLSPSTITQFRTNQVRLYLILMSLWGFFKSRALAQFSTFMHIALMQQKPWYTVTVDDLRQEKKVYVLEWLFKRKDSERKYFHLLFMWLLLCAGFIQIGRQIALLLN